MLIYKNLDIRGVKELAETLALEAGGRDMVIGLTGDLGAGKTVFVQAFGKALGIKKITSPTFIVVASHRLPDLDFYHIDFYRLRSQSELNPLGIFEIISSSKRIVLIEWVDRFPAVLKKCDIVVNIKTLPHNLRDVQILTN